MWTILTLLVLCAVCPSYTIRLQQHTGPIHIRSPLQANDEQATKNAVLFIKDLQPKLDFIYINKSINSILLPELNAVFTLALYEFFMRGFEKATLDNLVVRMSKSRVDFKVSVPGLAIVSSAFVRGVIDNNEFAIVGNWSSFSSDIQITGILDFQKLQLPSEVNVLQITDADIKLDIGDNLILVTLTEELVPFKLTVMEFMNKNSDDVIKSVYRAALRLVNEQLAKIPADIIIDYLVPPNEEPELEPVQSLEER